MVTALIALVERVVAISNISMLYLPAVLIAAVRYGRGTAIAASIAAFLAFDYFFIDPRFEFTVSDPSEWLSLGLLLLTGVVAAQLAADQRVRADEAQIREREAVVLYDVVRIMSEPDLERALRAAAERIRGELRLAAVVIELRDGAAPRRVTAGDDTAVRTLANVTAARVLGAGTAPDESRRGAPGRWVRVISPYRSAAPSGTHAAVPVVAEGRRLGTLLLLAPPDRTFGPAEDRLLSAVAAQLGTALERERLRRDAADAEVLRRTDELKSALLNAVSHDLRTPLASILAGASSLRQRDVNWSDEERDEFLTAIEEEAKRLDRLVGNLLDLSRIEAGALRPQLGWYDAGALVDDVVGRLRALTSGHQVVVNVPDDLPPVPLDYVEIDHVLSNLVENAVKYSPRGTEIDIDVSVRDGTANFAVRDHGPGVPRAEDGQLFRAFHRLERRPAGVGGLGLGLAIAKRLVEAHGGKIWHEHPADGGARFVFSLPMQPAA